MRIKLFIELVTIGFCVAATPLSGQAIIYFDSFTADDGTLLLGKEPETNNGVSGAIFHESNNFWSGSSDVGIFNNRAQLGADNQLNLPIATDGTFVPPEVIGVSVILNLGTTAGPPDPDAVTNPQRGIGLGFFAGTGMVATPDNFRGLMITTNGRLIFVQHGFEGSPRAGLIEELSNGIDTSVDHSISYEINTTTGDIENILLDGIAQPDVETTLFNADVNHVGIMVSSQSGGTLASYDDFTVTDGAATGGGDPLEITDFTYDPTTNVIRLTWNSDPGRLYAVKYSEDMTSWNFDLDDGVLGEEESGTTTVEFNLDDFPAIQTLPRLFFRIEESS